MLPPLLWYVLLDVNTQTIPLLGAFILACNICCFKPVPSTNMCTGLEKSICISELLLCECDDRKYHYTSNKYDIMYSEEEVNMYLKNRKRAALVCQVRSSIRCFPELPYQEMIAVFKGIRPLTKDIYCYFYGFFEECSPKLIKRFMEEENISRTQIVNIFDSLPELGEKYFFRKAIADGQF